MYVFKEYSLNITFYEDTTKFSIRDQLSNTWIEIRYYLGTDN